ncbi:MAG: PEP-CTERM sorting domain-containing protein [Acidobacteriaceae bacterium]
MKIHALSGLIAALALTVPALAHADQVITFEGYASGTVFTNQFPGVDFSNATVLTEGISLSSDYPPESGVNVVYNAVSGPMTITFTDPVAYFEGYFTYDQPLVIDAYNAADVLVDSYDSVCSANYIGSGTACSPNELGEVTGTDITEVTIAGGGGDNFTLDNAEFTGSINSATTPEPGTIALLGTGILGLVGSFRRKLAASRS